MKRFWAMFVLTRPEQRLVIFVALALVLGAYVKHHRELKMEDRPRDSESSLTPLVSPSPGEQ